MPSQRMLPGIFACGLALALAGCEVSSSSSSTSTFVEINGGNLTEIEASRLGASAFVIVVENGVVYRYTSVSSSTSQTVVEKTINGLPFEVGDDHLRIGETSYGPFEAGAKVHVRPDGVFVGETSFGALPDA